MEYLIAGTLLAGVLALLWIWSPRFRRLVLCLGLTLLVLGLLAAFLTATQAIGQV